MKLAISLFIALLSLQSFAHNMSEEKKREKIKRAIASFSSSIGYYDIEISNAPFKFDYQLQAARLDSGDQDIDEFSVKLNYQEKDYSIKCDLLSGEYGETKTIYFMVYKNCNLINLTSYKTQAIKLKTQTWDDWRY